VILDRRAERFVGKGLESPEDWMVSTTAEAREAFIADAESDQGGFVQVERKLGLGTRGIFVHQTTVDADDLQRAFLEVVSLLRIEGEDLAMLSRGPPRQAQ
jgi:hypothetical protein